MPNHVTTRLAIKASEERKQEVINAICEVQEDGKYWFDFNKIIPMPSDLAAFDDIYMGAELCAKYFYENKITPDWDARPLKFESFGRPDECREEEIPDAKKMYENLKKYGIAHGLNWHRLSWGTKWNSYDCDKTDYGLKFQTAWNYPAPVILRLSAMFPDVEFFAEFADEDIGYNCGWLKYLGGNITDFRTFSDDEAGSDEAIRFACRINEYNYDDYINDRA